MVERSVRDQEVAGSNPVSPTNAPAISKDVTGAFSLTFLGDARRKLDFLYPKELVR